MMPFAEFDAALKAGTLPPEPPRQLRVGELVAWSIRSYAGHMDGISSAHRVASLGEQPKTCCGQEIPVTLLMPPLSSYEPCGACEWANAEQLHGLSA